MADVQVYIAADDGYAILDGAHYHFHKDQTTVEAGHPLLKSSPDSFRPFEPTYTKAQHELWKKDYRKQQARVEQAQSEPEPEPESEPVATS